MTKREYAVKLPGKVLSEIVKADYVALQGGHLCFRNQTRGSYPDTVRVFAPGAWLEFEALTEAQPAPLQPRHLKIAGCSDRFDHLDFCPSTEGCG